MSEFHHLLSSLFLLTVLLPLILSCLDIPLQVFNSLDIATSSFCHLPDGTAAYHPSLWLVYFSAAHVSTPTPLPPGRDQGCWNSSIGALSRLSQMSTGKGCSFAFSDDPILGQAVERSVPTKISPRLILPVFGEGPQ